MNKDLEKLLVVFEKNAQYEEVENYNLSKDDKIKFVIRQCVDTITNYIRQQSSNYIIQDDIDLYNLIYNYYLSKYRV